MLVADAALTAVTPVMAQTPGACMVLCTSLHTGAGSVIRKMTKSTRRKTPSALGAGARALASDFRPGRRPLIIFFFHLENEK